MSYAAIVSREFDIPCVIGTKSAMSEITHSLDEFLKLTQNVNKKGSIALAQQGKISLFRRGKSRVI